MCSVIGNGAGRHIKSADEAEYHIFGLGAEEDVIQPDLAVIGDGVLVFVGNVDHVHTLFQRAVILVAADVGKILVRIACPVIGQRCDGAFCIARAAGNADGVDGISPQSREISPVSADQLRVCRHKLRFSCRCIADGDIRADGGCIPFCIGALKPCAVFRNGGIPCTCGSRAKLRHRRHLCQRRGGKQRTGKQSQTGLVDLLHHHTLPDQFFHWIFVLYTIQRVVTMQNTTQCICYLTSIPPS